ncbi:MAG: TIGR03016 family PEP-CTERM system-associated outer membrane protein [Gammaproteobacteria bacterium]
MKRIKTFVVLAGIMLSQAAPAEAANWNFTPYLVLGQAYTDNVSQAPKGEEQDEFISLLNPGFFLIRDQGRVRANIAYQMQNLYYAKESDFETFHQLDAFGVAEVAQDHVFIDASSSISQQVIDARQAAPVSNLSLNDNRADVFTAAVSPYVRQQFGATTEAIARYRYGIVDFDDDEAGGVTDDITVNGGLLGVGALPEERRYGWLAAYSQERVGREDTDAVDTFERAGLRLDYMLTRVIGLTALGGYEENDFESTTVTDFNTKGEYWEAGVRLQPTSQDLIEARYGERFFGNTFFFSWDRLGRRFATRIAYTEDVTTVAQSLLGGSDQLLSYGILRPADGGQMLGGANAPRGYQGVSIDPDTGLPEPGTPIDPDTGLPVGGLSLTSEVFVSKRLDAGVTFNTAKTATEINLFQEDRDFLGVTESEDERVRGIETLLTWHLTSRTDLLAGADFARQDFEESEQSADVIHFRLGLQRFIGSRTFARLEGRRTQRESEDGLDEFVENAVVVTATRLF